MADEGAAIPTPTGDTSSSAVRRRDGDANNANNIGKSERDGNARRVTEKTTQEAREDEEETRTVFGEYAPAFMVLPCVVASALTLAVSIARARRSCARGRVRGLVGS